MRYRYSTVGAVNSIESIRGRVVRAGRHQFLISPLLEKHGMSLVRLVEKRDAFSGGFNNVRERVEWGSGLVWFLGLVEPGRGAWH